MPTAASIFRKLLAIALILLMQGPALLVQEVAWAKMLVSYTQERGWMRGVVDTFDGNHPCELCHKASEIRHGEGKGDPAERPGEGMRFRLCWAEMIVSDLLRMPVPMGRDIAFPVIACHARDSGRGTDAPLSPPPQMG